MTDLLIDLATAGVGGRVLEASDEYYAPKERIIRDEDAVAEPGRYTDRGRWTDGWVTRRRREAGHEWLILRLGYQGILRHLVVDTSHIVGDVPEAISVEAASFAGDPNIVDLVRSRDKWSEIVSRTDIEPDELNDFTISHSAAVTHIRLVVYPDGGIARFRCLGEPVPPPGLLDGKTSVDLAPAAHGGRVVDASSRSTNPNVMLRRSDVRKVGDIWETPRRRESGNEWAVIRLAGAGTVTRLVVDTSTIGGSVPREVSVEATHLPQGDIDELRHADWATLLSRRPLDENRVHAFGDLPDVGEATHLRLNLHPDGAIARIRAYGVSSTPWHEA